MTKFGIDVSEWQGKIDWSRVKTDFAIIKAGYGKHESQKDPYFEANYKACKANNVPCGAYWYSYATTPDEAVMEAEACVKAILGKSFEYPIFFDIERSEQFATGKDNCSAIVNAFCYVLEKAGYFVGIYSSKSHLETYLTEDVRKRYAVWVAHYGVRKTDYSGNFGMWQKSETGRIDGISGNVDLDECHIDYPAIIKNAGLNGFKKTAAESATAEKKEPQKIYKCAKITLSDAKLYANAYTRNISNKVSGDYYIYDAQSVNGRLRITTKPQNCGKMPMSIYVTGWIGVSELK